jgi:hypothetical protein
VEEGRGSGRRMRPGLWGNDLKKAMARHHVCAEQGKLGADRWALTISKRGRERGGLTCGPLRKNLIISKFSSLLKLDSVQIRSFRT